MSERMNIWTCVSCDTPARAAVVREAGGACSLCGFVGFKYGPAKTLDDVCRTNPYRSDEPCPACGYVTATAPTWARHNTTFALSGKRYRIVAVGSTNAFAPRHAHSEDYARCELIGDAPWSFPGTPCPIGDVQQALDGLFSLPAFRPHQLVDAYMIEGP
jgi:hypothetical protein